MASKESEIEQNALDDVTSLLSKIDALVSTSGVLEPESVKTQEASAVELNADDLKAQGFVDAQIEEITKGKDAKIEVEKYAKPCYNWMQMCEIRLGLLEGLDTEIYESPLFSANQMREIRLGLFDHLEVISYASLVLAATDMQNKRKSLFAKSYKQNPKAFGHLITDDETGIQIRISDDCMRAFLTVPGTTEATISKATLMDALHSNAVVYGILEEEIANIADNQIIDQEVCIANGKSPIVGKPGRYELFFENCIEKGRTAPPDGDIDYKDVNIVEMAKPGIPLMQYHPAQTDVNGITVTGITVEGTPGEDLPPLTGVGFRFDAEQNLYIATESGYASYSDTTSCLNVWQTYKFDGDLCYYQSVEYDGSVHVYGSVRSSSVIRATGDIIIDGFLENASLYTKQNVVIKGGANGCSHGEIVAGGSVRGNFFENIDIKANGLIEGNYFLNCNIVTDDRLIARGKKARILGGDVVAAVGVEAVLIGNYMSKKTLFNVGDIYELEKRIHTLEHDRDKSQNDMEQLIVGRQKLSLMLGDLQADGNTLYQKTNLAIQIKENHIKECDHEIARLNIVMKRAEKAYIRVQKELQADVIFTINGVKKIAEKTIQHALYLTKESSQSKQKKQGKKS